ncbi:MAG: hypothetical protein A2Y14_04935 [Verrucomicrobia bacterium GWF2_51_19]|nr:MAG: hypothetical protein A2Y14_04935 [Verrucomicrobia bacterium GWF2_51_19]HCJ11956.1 hypothetical protein [Opitutae bacterium]
MNLPNITGGHWTREPEGPWGRFCIDSRVLQPGDAFVAVKGRSDGHNYVKAAEEAGARFAIVETVQQCGLPQLQVKSCVQAFLDIAHAIRKNFSGPVIGITGSVGKTSTKDCLRTLFGPRTHASHKNFNNALGVPLTLQDLNNDVFDTAIVEMGINAPGEMDVFQACVQPDYAIITNIHATHLEGLGSLDNVATEKAKIAKSAKKVFVHKSFLKYKAIGDLGNKLVTPDEYSLSCNTLTLAGHTFTLPLMSPGMAQNVIIALSCALYLKKDPRELANRLLAFETSDFREKWIQSQNRTYFADCYNASPASMLNSIAFFQAQAASEKQRLYVLGEMRELGQQSHALHSDVGQKLSFRPHDTLCLIGGESILALKNAIQLPPSKTYYFPNTQAAIPVVQAFSGTVYLKGSHSFALEQLIQD